MRCGRCGEEFNALELLAEDSTGFVGGESPLDLEERADSILESVGVPQIAQTVAKDYEESGPPGVEIAHLEVIGWTVDEQRGTDPATDDDRSLEFTLPPGELDRIFIESKKRPLQPVPLPSQPPAADIEIDLPSELPQEPQPLQPLQPPQPSEPPPRAERRVGRYEAAEVSDDVRRDMLQGFEEAVQPPLPQPRAARAAAGRRRLLLWLGAAVFSALLLIVQIAHRYMAVGAPQAASANFSAYQLRQWGVTGDPDANGTLRVRASILNTAAQLQPYPLLRVTLADRFGKSIGTRDFEPSEYLGKPTAKLLAPGERVDATLQILDPGKNAEGFEIDVCLRGTDQKIACANDVASQGKQ